ncbi:MAG TPA: hypothetical protein VKI65_13425 [Gemmataceae bacterium]|nr:hypothetical protein [Gemmataceae bacterium]
MAQVTVEFYGIPRQRAGRAELAVSAETVAEALTAVERQCPALKELVQADGRVSPHYLVSIEGEHFVSDLQQPLAAGNRLLVLSADPGG